MNDITWSIDDDPNQTSVRGFRCAGHWTDFCLSPVFDFKQLCRMHPHEVSPYLTSFRTSDKAAGQPLPPIEYDQEVWACGVTYSRSRDAREAETDIKNIYDRVYEAKRPELFFKAIGWRVKGTHSAIRIRKDSHWNVPGTGIDSSDQQLWRNSRILCGKRCLLQKYRGGESALSSASEDV